MTSASSAVSSAPLNKSYSRYSGMWSFVAGETIVSTFADLQAACLLAELSRWTGIEDAESTSIEGNRSMHDRTLAAALSSGAPTSTSTIQVPRDGTVFNPSDNRLTLSYHAVESARSPLHHEEWSGLRGWQDEQYGITIYARCRFPVDRKDQIDFEFYIEVRFKAEKRVEKLLYHIANFKYDDRPESLLRGGIRWLEACYAAFVENNAPLRDFFKGLGFTKIKDVSSLLRQIGRMICKMKLIFEPREIKEGETTGNNGLHGSTTFQRQV
ncbi:hypothetical protein QFC22_005201 [Naganishia vaughanmartiniae]|uniref:Uncharacterized protein n=1 Tax=Naganishia vaughanmartiniae TaxID=1424756 RepID=A0ACC2WVG8_9TREE|nr:hypothetical protein QFC22_005201 [Naganishia vaughanmartiniae]